MNHHAEHLADKRLGQEGHVKELQQRLIISVILTVPVILLSLFPFHGSSILQLIFSTLILLYGAGIFFNGFIQEMKLRVPGMMTLISIALIAAYSYSAFVVIVAKGMPFFSELVTLIDVMLLGHFLEMRAVIGASAAVEALTSLLPSTAHVLIDGAIHEKQTDTLKKEMKILIRPGEKVPADGKIIQGESELQEAALTGEAVPVYKTVGASVIAGSINGNGSLVVAIEKDAHENYIAQVIKTVKAVMQSKSTAQDLADKIAQLLTYAALSFGIVSIVASMLYGFSLSYGLERFVTVLVTACPHALGLAIPLVIIVISSRAAKEGLLIRNRKAFERAAQCNLVVFDKTGTLTEGLFSVTDIIASRSMSAEKIVALAASTEKFAQHALTRAFIKKARELKLEQLKPSEGETIPGKGVRVMLDAKELLVGNYLLMNEYLSKQEMESLRASLEKQSKALMAEGKTVVFAAYDGQCQGLIAAADTIRSSSFVASKELKKLGIKYAMITGDNEQSAYSVAKSLSIEMVYAQILPHEKAKKIEELREQGYTVAMVGDGINDAPALAAADIGIAIGAGTDVARETSDIILVRNDPTDVVELIRLSRIYRKKITQNVLLAVGYNIIALPIAAGLFEPLGITLSPALGAVAMSLSTIIVAINARFMLS